MSDIERKTPFLVNNPSNKEAKQQQQEQSLLPSLQPTSPITSSSSPHKDIILGIVKAIEGVLDWSAFIAVQILGSDGTHSLSTAFLAGTVAAIFVIFYWFLKTPASLRNEYTPKTLDAGTFLLFASLYLLALLTEHIPGNYTTYLQQLLFLWFNPITTGGIGLIMYISILKGQPFVYEYVRKEVPSAVYDRLMSKKWFREMLTNVAMFWVKTLVVMTIIVSIQPLLVTIFYDGNPKNDASGFMTALGAWLTIGQLLILFGTMYHSSQMSGPSSKKVTKRVKHVKMNGLTDEEKELYGNAVVVENPSPFLASKTHRIQSLTNEDELNLAGEVLTDAFQGDEMTNDILDENEKEARLSFFRANIKSVAMFNHVFGCFDTSIMSNKPQAVMSCIPVYSKSHEELNIFNTFDAWLEYGFTFPTGESGMDFPLPSDDLMEVGLMKKKEEHGLNRIPFLSIAFFGSDTSYRGQGYGKTLLKYVIQVSEEKQIPLVLETGTVKNRIGYEKYGFKVVDQVKTRPNWVLMIRHPGSQRSTTFGYGAV